MAPRKSILVADVDNETEPTKSNFITGKKKDSISTRHRTLKRQHCRMRDFKPANNPVTCL